MRRTANRASPAFLATGIFSLMMTWEVGVCSSGDPQDNRELSQPCASNEFRQQDRLLATSGVLFASPLT